MYNVANYFEKDQNDIVQRNIDEVIFDYVLVEDTVLSYFCNL